jgi:hypothetical protein
MRSFKAGGAGWPQKSRPDCSPFEGGVTVCFALCRFLGKGQNAAENAVSGRMIFARKRFGFS